MMRGDKAAERRSAHGPGRMRQLSLFAIMSLRLSTPERHDAEQRHAGDGVQRPLRSRFPPRLMPSVDMICIATACAKRR